LTTGQHPFASDSPIGVLHAILSREPVAPGHLKQGIPAELDGLILRMLDKDARLRPTATEVAGALLGLGAEVTIKETGAAVFPGKRSTVGRETEHAEIRAAFESAAAGPGLLLCVAGEPGIGKTTLVEGFLAELATRRGSCNIARGRCSERLGRTEAYLPFLEVLESLLRSETGESVERTMKLLAPTWYRQIVPSVDNSSGLRSIVDAGVTSQDRMKRELGTLLLELCRLRPLVAFLDDLQWADASTIDLLAYLAGRFESTRILIVVTYRASELLVGKHPFLTVKLDLQARGVCREVPLGFLGRRDIEAYLALEFPNHRFPADFPTIIHTHTEGSPLFMVDLLRYLRDRKVIARDQGGWVVAPSMPDIRRDLPESVRSMIELKIDQIKDTDRRLLMAASVRGYEFDSAVVAEALSMDAGEVEERLEFLDRVHSFVRLVGEQEFPDRTLTLRYRFVHILYQNVLYRLLTPARKSSLGAATAQALLDHHGQQSAMLASELALLFEIARDVSPQPNISSWRLRTRHVSLPTRRRSYSLDGDLN
jgi:predicted ATPase